MELAYILRAVRRYWWVVVLGASLGLFSGYVVDSGGSAEHQASSILLLSPGSGSGNERFVQNEFVILGSHAVAEQAANELGNLTAGRVGEVMTLLRIPDSDLVRITATASNAASARALADAYADAYLALATDRESGQARLGTLNDAIDELEDRLAVVDANIAEAMAPFLEDPAGIIVPDIEQVSPTLATERSLLLEQYSQLLTNRNEIELGGEVQLGSRVVEYASGSTIVAGAGSKLVVVVGLTAGTMIGVLGAVVVSRLSGMVLDANDAASTLQVPVVATVPRLSNLSRHAILPGDPLPPALRRTIRELAVRAETSAPSTDAGRGALVVLVAGAERCSGATTIAVALAGHFAAERGNQVLLVDADVTRPRLSAALGDDASGIGVLLGNSAESNSARAPFIRTAATGVLFVGLGEGHTRRSLRRQDVSVLLDGAAQHAQVVVIDGGSLMASASSVEFARRADAIVLTMPAQRQTRAGLDAVASPLASRRGGLLPVVTAAHRVRRGSTFRTVVDLGTRLRSLVRHGTTSGSVAAGDGEASDGPVERSEAVEPPVERGDGVNASVGRDEALNGPVEHDDVIADQAVPPRSPAEPPNRGRARARQSASAASRRGTSRGT